MVASVTPVESPALLSDAKLAARWKNMAETALSVDGCLDLQGMTSIFENRTNENEDSDEMGAEENSQMDIDDTAGDPEAPKPDDTAGPVSSAKSSDGRFLPFGAGLLPTSNGRGSLLHKLPILDIEKGMEHALFSGGGFLGKV
jgi:hypothetical protein